MKQQKQRLLTPAEITSYSNAYKDPELAQIYIVTPALVERVEAFWDTKSEEWAKTAHNNRIPAHMAIEAQLSRAVAVLWFEFDKVALTTTEREYIAQDFIIRWISDWRLRSIRVVHPATRKKEKTDEMFRVPITDVLGDFVMNPDIVAERRVDYPVENPDKEVRGERKRRKTEFSILLQEESDALKADGEEYPRGMVAESKLVKTHETELSEPDVDEFRAELLDVKRNAAEYATKYRDRFGYTEAETMQRIYDLDLSRVAECVSCGNAFYRHDLRQVYCDTQRTKGRRSMCQKKAEEMQELARDYAL